MISVGKCAINVDLKAGKIHEWCFYNQAGRHFQCRHCALYLNMDRLSIREHIAYKEKYFDGIKQSNR